MQDKQILLLVDDEPAVLQALRRMFRNETYEIRTAESAAAALELFDSSSSVRVVISDYRMPGMNGVEFLKEVYRRSPETVRIILSGFADRANLQEALLQGRIYKYLPKPWDDTLIKSTVRRGIDLTAAAWERREQIRTLVAENMLLQQRVGEVADGTEKSCRLTYANGDYSALIFI